MSNAQQLVTWGVTPEMQTKLLLVGGELKPTVSMSPRTWSVLVLNDPMENYHDAWWAIGADNKREFDDPLSAYNAFWRAYRLMQEEKSA